MKVIVLGAGIVGVTTAWCLARDGHEVTVVDRQADAASETSQANAGLIAPGHAYAWASPKAPGIMLKSLWRNDQALRLKPRPDPRMWSWMARFLRQCTAERARINTINKLRLSMYSQQCMADVVAETGVPYDGRDGGGLYIYRGRRAFEAGVAKTAILSEHGLRVEALDPDEAVAREPALAPRRDRIAGAIYVPSDASGDACMFSRNLARHTAERFGATLLWNTTIRGLAADGDRIDRLVTDQGDMQADMFVLSLGCDSPFLARPLGIRLPIYPVKGYSVTLPVAGRNGAPTIAGVDEEALVAWARMGDRLRITATAEFSGYSRDHRPKDFRTMFRVARELFPDGADYDRPDYWAGLRPMTPQGTPFLGRTPFANLMLNTGQGHMGWTMSFGSARIVADLITGRDPAIDLAGMTLDQR